MTKKTERYRGIKLKTSFIVPLKFSFEECKIACVSVDLSREHSVNGFFAAGLALLMEILYFFAGTKDKIMG